LEADGDGGAGCGAEGELVLLDDGEVAGGVLGAATWVRG